MPILTDSIWTDLLLGLTAIICSVYWYITSNYDYWERRGVPHKKGGLFMDMLLGRRPQSEGMVKLYKSFPDEKYFGMFQTRQPTLVIKDPELIRKILVKDFIYFQDRGGLQNKNDPMGANLFNLRGKVWRAMRYKLTPTFSTGKLKGMFEQVTNCGDSLERKIDKLTEAKTDVEAKSFIFEYTSEVISSCAFGLQFTLGSESFEIFKEAVTKLFKPNLITFLKFLVYGVFPKLAEFLNFRVFVQKKEADYFMALIKETTAYRREKNVKRNDYLQLLMTLQDQEDSGQDMGLAVPSDLAEDDAIIDQMKYAGQGDHETTNLKLFTDVTVAANSVIFLVAGAESASSTITHTLLELARHPQVQQQLQAEVDRVMDCHGQRWTYQAVKDMVYLDQVVQEAQRLYPIISLLMRQCTKPYKLPDRDLVIEEGVLVVIPVIALHKDAQYYPDPEVFRPERFEGNNFKPSPVYLPYGDGPRICIAMRFAVMEVKMAVARIMARHTIRLSPKTKLPITMNPRSFIPLVEGGVWLEFERRK